MAVMLSRLELSFIPPQSLDLMGKMSSCLEFETSLNDNASANQGRKHGKF